MVANPIRNIIFDFGGVICDIDISLTEKAFIELGIRQSGEDGSTGWDEFLERFETGQVSPEEFRTTLKMYFSRPVSDDELDRAWNALLDKIPAHRITLLDQLRSTYRIFLLSNTNPIHYVQYAQDLQENFGFRDFNDLFETAFFSHEIHLRKPSREVFEYILNHAGLRAPETLFIDDTSEHVEGARNVGLQAYHLRVDEEITDLFSPEMKFLKPL